jgi:hypothetical protein
VSGQPITASHMQLAALKELTVRFIAAEMRAKASQPLLHALLDEFSSIDPKEVARNDSLSKFLNAQQKRACCNIQPKITSANRGPANSHAVELKRRITQRSCAGCKREDTKKKRKPYVCGQGSAARDAQQVARVGNCIRPIRGLYDYWHRVVVALISEWAFVSDNSGTEDLTVTFSTECDEPESTSIEVNRPYQVSGATEFLDEHVLPARASDVSLTFTTARLNWNSILAIPWLLTHELVCHAFQGKSHPNTPRYCEVDCPFYEGWMDEVAFRLLQGNLASGWTLTTAGESDFLTQYPAHILDEAAAYRRWRYGEGPVALASVHAPLWRIGRTAAEDALSFFERWHQNEDASARKYWALRKVAVLSFRLQRLDPAEQALELVAAIGRVCAEGIQDRATPEQAERIEEVLMAPATALTPWITKIKSL